MEVGVVELGKMEGEEHRGGTQGWLLVSWFEHGGDSGGIRKGGRQEEGLEGRW